MAMTALARAIERNLPKSVRLRGINARAANLVGEKPACDERVITNDLGLDSEARTAREKNV